MDLIGSILGIVTPVINSIFPNPEDKLKAQQMQNDITTALIAQQNVLVQSQAGIIMAEAQSGSWLARNWRPITMLVFVFLVVCHWFGLNASGISEAQYLSLFDLIKIGLGGYVVGRSAEKIASTVAPALKKS